METCSKCGFAILNADRYCGGCGLLLSGLRISPDHNEGLILYKPPLGTDRALLSLRNVGQRTINVMASIENSDRLAISDDAETRTVLNRLAPDGSIDLEVLGEHTHPGDRGLAVLSFGDQRIQIPVSVAESPRLRIEPTDDKVRIVRQEGLLLALEIDGPDEGQTEISLPLQLVGTRVLHPLVIDRLQFDDKSHIRLEPTTELPFTMSQDGVLGMVAMIPVSVIEEADTIEGFNISIVAIISGMETVQIGISVVVRPRARLAVNNWEAFNDDDTVLVRGVGDIRDSHLELINRGQSDATILAVVFDTDFVQLKRLPEQPVVRARGEPIRIPLAFNPDYLDEDRILKHSGEAIPLRLEVTFRSGDQPPETKHFKLSVRVKNAPELEGPLIIDFGTTNTCAAYHTPRGRWELIDLHVRSNESGVEFPSLMMFLDHEKLAQGLWEESLDLGENIRAALVARIMSRAVASQLKSRLWSNAELWIQEYRSNNLGDPKDYSGEELARWFIKAAVTYAERKIRMKIRKLFLTYPAIRQFDATVRNRLRKAASDGTGIPISNVQCDLAEPEALGYSELLSFEEDEKKYLEKGEERSFAIVDIGGGTSDISIYKVRGQGRGESVEYYKLRSSGIDVAGEAITFRIARSLLQNGLEILEDQDLKREYEGIWKNIPEFWYEFNPARLKPHHHETFTNCIKNADRIKRELKRTPKISDEAKAENSDLFGFVSFSSESGDLEKREEKVSFSAEDLRSEVSPLADQILGALYGAIQELRTGGQLPEGIVDRILLRGNGARFTYIRDRFEDMFGEKKIHYDSVHPKTGVALGAAKYWHIWVQTGSGPRPLGVGKTPPQKLMRDVGLQRGTRFVPMLRAGESLEDEISPSHERLLMRAFSKILVFDNYDGNNLEMPMETTHGKELIGRPVDLSMLFHSGEDRLKIRLLLKTRELELLARVEVQRRGIWKDAGVFPVATWEGGGWQPPEGEVMSLDQDMT